MLGAGLAIAVVGVTAQVNGNAAANDPVDDATTADRLTTPQRTFTVAAVGDLLPEDRVMSRVAEDAAGTGADDFSPMFVPITPIIRWVDLAICHMETPLGGPGERVGAYGRSSFGGNLLAGPYEFAGGVCATSASTGAALPPTTRGTSAPWVSLPRSPRSTLPASATTGPRWTPEAAHIDVMTIAGVRVAHLSITTFSNTPLPGDPWRMDFVGNVAEIVDEVDRRPSWALRS